MSRQVASFTPKNKFAEPASLPDNWQNSCLTNGWQSCHNQPVWNPTNLESKNANNFVSPEPAFSFAETWHGVDRIIPSPLPKKFSPVENEL
jgi:hypothetical protein